jgi:hypothetical protein
MEAPTRAPMEVVPPAASADLRPAPRKDRAEQAHKALQIGFVALLVVAGIDKFANELTDWTQFLAPIFPQTFGVGAQTFMYGIGFLEIALSIGIALRPRVFGDVFAGYLGLIIVNLLMQGLYLEIALHDFALAAGACALARLSAARERAAEPWDGRSAVSPALRT